MTCCTTGFSQVADMRVVCGHKDTDGVIYWPEYAVKPEEYYVSPSAFPAGHVVGKQLDWRNE